MSFRLGVDLGTTFTAAAVADGVSEPTVIGLGNRALQIPSVLFLRPDGEFLVGEAAERRGLTEPDRLAREFKRRIGDHVPIMVARAPFSPQALTAHLLRWVVDRVVERMGARPDEVILTHPANWGPFRLELLDQIAVMAGLTSARRCTEPEAAAVQYTSQTRVTPGARVAVYDLGGGTFDACVLEKTGTGFRILGAAEGVEHLGGVDFDEAVLHHVLTTLGPSATELDPDDPAVTVALARLRRDCVEAKEALSTDVDTLVPVTLPGLSRTVRVTRAEFETMIRPALNETMAAMSRALHNAHVEPATLRSILLVGGSSRIPLVSELLYREFGVPTTLDTHPKHDVALGAVRIGREDTDTLPGILLSLGPATEPKPTAPTPEAAPAPAAMKQAATGGPPSATIAGPTSIQRPPSGAPPADPAVEGEKESEGIWSAKNDSNAHPGKRRRLGLIAAAAAALVAVVATTLILVLRDPNRQAGSAATTPTPTPTPSRSAAVKPLLGSYTWASGVQLTLSVQAERFGVRYPYCEDGSCGFAEENDIRVLLTYKISVPKGLRDRVDPAACPGRLTTTTSAPTDSIRAVPDSHARPIKTVMAGQTAIGVLEYSVDERLRTAQFQVNSTCGDVQQTSEGALFRGPLPALRVENTPNQIGGPPVNRSSLSLRVDQVREDVKSRTYAALVEVCARQTLSSDRKRSVRNLGSWYLVSRDQWRTAEDGGPLLLPRYPYGSLRKGSCVSGWVIFDLEERDTPTEIGYNDGLAKYTWRVAEDRPTRAPEQNASQPPATTPPDSTGPPRQPDQSRPSREPSEEPSGQPSPSEPEPSGEPSPSAPPEPSSTPG